MKKNWKKKWMAVTVLSLLLGGGNVPAVAQSTVSMEGAVMVEGRTFLPLRSILETLGATVNWDPDTQTATAVKGETQISMQIDSTSAEVGGKFQTLDVPPQLIQGRTMVPVRFVSEALGGDVEWQQSEGVVAVSIDGRHLRISVEDPVKEDELNRVRNFQRNRHAVAAHYDGWVYYYKTWPYNYHNPSVNGLYKEKLDGTLDGTGQLKLTNEEIYSLTVVDGWIYYTTFNEQTLEGPFYLYKMSLDGKTKKRLLTLDFPADVAYIDKDWIYYAPSSTFKENDQYGTLDLYKIGTDGTNRTFIASLEAPTVNIVHMQVVGDYIYYLAVDGLYRIKSDGSDKMRYDGEITPESGGFIVKGDWIYYSQAFDLRKARTDGSEIVQLLPGWMKQQEDGTFTWRGFEDELYSSSQVFTFSVKGKYLYFLKQKELHRYDLTTGEIVQLNNEPTNILILGDYIYSSVSTFKDKPKLIKID